MSMSSYSFKYPSIVYGGENSINNIELILKDKYKKIALFTDKGIEASGLLDAPLNIIKSLNIEVEIFNDLPSEPSCDQAQKVIDDFKNRKAEFIVAIGGGSVMDIAKLASILSTDEYKVRDLLDNPTLAKKQIKTLLIPTTAGTGSEATINSIVSVPEKELKIGIVNENMIADYVILDVNMIKQLPKKILAATGVDALAHAIECFTSNKANPFSNMYALESLKLIFNNIEKAYSDKDDLCAKNSMLIASFYAGVAITSSGTTAVHALSYPLGGKYHIPHGVSNAILLVPVMKFNAKNCKAEFVTIYNALNPQGYDKSDDEKVDWLVNKLDKLVEFLEIPKTLGELGIKSDDLDFLVDAGMKVQRLLVNNKRTLTKDDARNIYLQIM